MNSEQAAELRLKQERRDSYWNNYVRKQKMHGVGHPLTNVAHNLYVAALGQYYRKAAEVHGGS